MALGGCALKTIRWIKVLSEIIIGIFFFAVAAMRIKRYFGLEKWQVSLGLIGIAIFFFLLNIALMQYFIRKKNPEFASTEEAFPGVQKWELTAGFGIVPKWVSTIGLLSISALITAIAPWIIDLMRVSLWLVFGTAL